MRITKVKVEAGKPDENKGKMVLIHRKIKQGSLILEDFSKSERTGTSHKELPDCTKSVLYEYKNESFELSLSKQTIAGDKELKTPRCKQCQDRTDCKACKDRTKAIKELRKKVEELIKEVIHAAVEKQEKTEYSARFNTATSEDDMRCCLKAKFQGILRYKSTAGESFELNLPKCLAAYSQTKDAKTLTPYRDWIDSYLQKKRSFLEKSILNNRIVVNCSKEDTEQLSKRKQALHLWANEYETKKKIDLDELCSKYNINALSTSLNNKFNSLLQSGKGIKKSKFPHRGPDLVDANTNFELKKELQLHQSSVFGTKATLVINNIFKENRENVQLAIYNLEVVKYLEHYFPIKRRKQLLTVDQVRYYLKETTIRERVQMQLENAIRMHLLQQGKLENHNLKEDVGSNALSVIKRDEFFMLNFVEMCAFAANNIRNIIDKEQVNDILGKSDFEKSLAKGNFDENRYKLFYGVDLKSDTSHSAFDIQALWAMRGAVQQIRNEVIHYHTDTLNKIFKLDKFEYKDAANAEECKYTNTVFQTLLENSIHQLDEYFIEQLRSNNVLSYYALDSLNHLLGYCTISLRKSSIPFAPGFKNVYALGANLQYGNTSMNLKNYLLKDEKDQPVDPTKTKSSHAYPAFRFILKLVYNHIFLSRFLDNTQQNAFKEAVEFVLRNNKEEAAKATKPTKGKPNFHSHQDKQEPEKYAFKEIREMQVGETISSYMSYIHSYSVQEKERKGDENDNTRHNTDKFIEKVFTKGFDSFLSTLPTAFLYSPEDEQEVENEDYQALAIGQQVQHCIKSDNGTHILFFTFCKLLDGNHLSDLRNEWLKYYASDRTDSFHYDFALDIIELCLLGKDKEIVPTKEDITRYINTFVEGNEKSNRAWTEFYFQSDQNPVEYASINLLRKHGTLELLKLIVGDTYKVTQCDYDEWKTLKESIENDVNEREIIHKEWVELENKRTEWYKKNGRPSNKAEKDKINRMFQFPDSRFNKYKELCIRIERYNWFDNKLHLVHLKKLHNLIVQLLSRMARFVALWDRDFVHLDASRTEDEYRLTSFVNLKDLIDEANYERFMDNYQDSIYRKDGSKIEEQDIPLIKACVNNIKRPLYRETFFMKNGNAFSDRNFIAHFNYITKSAEHSMVDLINRLRMLMAYDRKLRNAVSKSIIHVFEQNGMELKFKCITRGETEHKLELESIKSKKMSLLKGKLEIDQVPEEYCKLCKQLLEMKK